MHANSKLTASLSCQGPEICCLYLQGLNENSLDAVQAAFASMAPCILGQTWRAEVEAGFAPGCVRVGWREDALMVFAELIDCDIFTNATAANQRMWELGDIFEIFLRPAGQTPYVEFHVTPNNQRLQLRIPDTEALRRAQAANGFEGFLLPGKLFDSVTWVQPKNHKWFILAVIPASTVSGASHLDKGDRWHFSFSRYDYTRGGGNPVVSSTSPHAVADFHRQKEWGMLNFVTAK